jgi:hypothetical protein
MDERQKRKKRKKWRKRRKRKKRRQRRKKRKKRQTPSSGQSISLSVVRSLFSFRKRRSECRGRHRNRID